MTADPIAAVVALLEADADVAALVGTRVYGGELPAGEADSMPRAAIVVMPTDGPSFAAESTVEHDTQRMDILAYGKTGHEAARVRAAAAAALTAALRVVSGGVLIHWVKSAGGFSSQREPDVGWPVAAQSWDVFFALSPAT